MLHTTTLTVNIKISFQFHGTKVGTLYTKTEHNMKYILIFLALAKQGKFNKKNHQMKMDLLHTDIV